MNNHHNQTHNPNRPFEIDQQISVMKEDIATRTRNLKLKQMLVSGGFFVLGGALLAGTLFFGGGATAPIASMGGQLLLGVGAVAGGAISSVVFAKEIKKLEMDEQFLEARLQGEVGNRYWQHYHNSAQQYSTQPPFNPGLQGAPPQDKGNSQGY